MSGSALRRQRREKQGEIQQYTRNAILRLMEKIRFNLALPINLTRQVLFLIKEKCLSFREHRQSMRLFVERQIDNL